MPARCVTACTSSTSCSISRTICVLQVVVTDTASYSDLVFGLFRMLGYQFAPRIADLSDTRFWRIDPHADYGPLNAVVRSRIDLRWIERCWPDMLRVAASLTTGAVRAYDVIRMLSREGQPSRLGRAFTEYGRIAKSLHLLAVIDIDDTYRRQGAPNSPSRSRVTSSHGASFMVSAASSVSAIVRGRRTNWARWVWS